MSHVDPLTGSHRTLLYLYVKNVPPNWSTEIQTVVVHVNSRLDSVSSLFSSRFTFKHITKHSVDQGKGEVEGLPTFG